MLSDLKFALRQLRKSPGFLLTAVLTLALGIGATTAIFTLVHAVLLKSLPVVKPEELYRIGDKVHCCMWGGYTQSEEFSLFNYELTGISGTTRRPFLTLPRFRRALRDLA